MDPVNQHHCIVDKLNLQPDGSTEKLTNETWVVNYGDSITTSTKTNVQGKIIEKGHAPDFGDS